MLALFETEDMSSQDPGNMYVNADHFNIKQQKGFQVHAAFVQLTANNED